MMNASLLLLFLVNIFSVSASTGLGLLVAGGNNDSSDLDVVEIINLETLSSCIVDVKLDVPRESHTGDGDLVCGGEDDDGNRLSSCYNIVTGTTINLINERYDHTSWTRGLDILLLGGWDGSGASTTELITGDTTQAGFDLKYYTV